MSHLLRGRPHSRPEEVRPGLNQYVEVEKENQNNDNSSRCCSVSVVAMETRQYAVGDVITMRLMRREKGSLVAMPSSQWEKVEEPVRFGGERERERVVRFLFCTIFSNFFLRPSLLFSPLDTRLSPYSKLLLASPSQALRMVEEEKAALQTQLSLEDEAQGCFIQSALCLLKVATASLCTTTQKTELKNETKLMF